MTIHDEVFVARVGTKMAERDATLDNGGDFVNVLSAGIAGEDAIESRAARGRLGLQIDGAVPALCTCQLVHHPRASRIGGPTDAHTRGSIGRMIGHYIANALGHCQQRAGQKKDDEQKTDSHKVGKKID